MNSSEQGIRDMIADLDEWSLKQLVMRLTETMGEDRCLRMIRDAAGADIVTDRNAVSEKVQAAVRSMDATFLGGSLREGCRSPRELAYILSSEAVRDCCMNDVSTLMRLGRRKDAERYVSGIADALLNVKCAITEHVPSCCRDMSDHFLQCARSGDVLGGFDF